MENAGKLIRQLLEIEANVASGSRYKTSAIGESEEEAEHGEVERRGDWTYQDRFTRLSFS